MMSDNEGLPSHIFPLFLTSQTQNLFNCVVDEQISETKPHKLVKKTDILTDLKNRAAVSDFHPAKQIIKEWPGDEVLLVYDQTFQYGENFYLITNQAEMTRLLSPPDNDNESSGTDHSEDELTTRSKNQGYFNPRREWLNLGSDQEIKENMVHERNRIVVKLSRKRSDFRTSAVLDDRVEDNQKPGVIVHCHSYADHSFLVERKTMDKSVQSISKMVTTSSQTHYAYPRNASIQTCLKTSSEDTDDTISDRMRKLFENVAPKLEQPLLQNSHLDVFTNDYQLLGEEDENLITKPDHHLREYQSFADIQFSKNKTVSHLQWHPTTSSLIAVSCMERMTFYERSENASFCLMNKSLILIWSFANPIHPLLLLEAPEDIECFQFNPLNPNIISGGCINGQIVLWDLTEELESLEEGSSPTHKDGNLKQSTPLVRYCTTTSVEHSHRTTVTDILWLTKNIEIGSLGRVTSSSNDNCTQMMSCSCDGSLIVWSLSKVRSTKHADESDMSASRSSSTPIDDWEWVLKPVHKVSLRSNKQWSAAPRPLKFITEMNNTPLQESQTNTEAVEEVTDHSTDDDKINSMLYIGTEDGDLIHVDWKSTKDVDTGTTVSSLPDFTHASHDSGICTLQKSPFFSDVFLLIGGWTWTVWRQGVHLGPLFRSGVHDVRLTCGCWSSTRGGVFFVGRSDGNIDVWDLLDKTHEPFLSQNITGAAINSIEVRSVSRKQQLLAAGDDNGTVHTFEIPWSLRRPPKNEVHHLNKFFDTQEERLNFLQQPENTCLSFTTGGDDAVPPLVETDEEWEIKAKIQYEEYLEFEKYWLNELGLLAEAV